MHFCSAAVARVYFYPLVAVAEIGKVVPLLKRYSCMSYTAHRCGN